MRLRPVESDDATAMARIRREALRERAADAYTEEQLDSLTADSDNRTPIAIERESFRTTVAVENGAVIGYGTVHPDDGQIHAAFVDPEHTESGVGRRVLAELEALAHEAGTDELFVLSTPNAVGFYERIGYRSVGEETLGEDPVIPVVRLEKP